MNSIFISIASYRDKLCNNTIKNIFQTAKFPQNIFIGVCQQNKDEQENCLGNLDEYKNQIRTINLKHTQAKGPCYARYLCSKLYKNEDYYLQIDSHTTFTKYWDLKCINMITTLKRNNINNPIISYYPRSSKDEINDDEKYNIPIVCDCIYLSEKNLPILNTAVITNTNNNLYITPFVTGGFMFLEGDGILQVPFLNNLDNVFFGEEILMSIRFFSHGFNVYTPAENICFHYYTREEEPKVWNDKIMDDKDGIKFIQDILNNKNNYGLGNKKTINDFYNFCKILPNQKKMIGNFCPK